MDQSDYTMTYFHIKDFDDKHRMRIKYPTLARTFKARYGIKRAYKKFSKLIDSYDWINVQQASELIDWNATRQFYLK
jgi:hypothetical protein